MVFTVETQGLASLQYNKTTRAASSMDAALVASGLAYSIDRIRMNVSYLVNY